MNEEPKSIWKKSWTGWRGFLLWFILVFVIFLIGLTVISTNLPSAWFLAAGFALVGVMLVAFVHWLWCWRNFKRFLFGLACLATLVALFYAEEDWRGWHAWQKFKHEWEAKGEHFDFTSIVPPPVPGDQNFALTPIVFTSYGNLLTRDGKEIPYKKRDTNFVDRLKMSIAGDDSWPYWRTNGIGNWQKAETANLTVWQNYYRTQTATANEFPVALQPQTPARDVLLALSKYDSTIQELRQASQLPYSRFPLNYDTENPFSILLPHLADLKRCSQVLQLRAIAELHDGQSEKALDDVKLMLRLADSVRTEPILISHLVRIAIVNLALQPVWEGLAEHKWSEAQLVELDRELAGLDFLSDYKLSMRGEMVLCQEGIIGYLRRHPEQLPNLSGPSEEGNASLPFAGQIICRSIPSGWFYQNQLRCSRFMVQQYLPLADLEHRIIPPASLRHADEALDLEFRNVGPYNRLEAMFLPGVGAAVKKFAYAQSSVDLSRTAIALERYRLAHGEYPETLDALTPQFIEKIPHDIINGQPLHYRRTHGGQFILYSVGWNETDDGGVAVTKTVGMSSERTPILDISQGDWVWRYPQK